MRERPFEIVIGWGIPLVLLALAAVMFWSPMKLDDPIPEAAYVDRMSLGAHPVRVAMHDPASIEVASFDVNCNQCHALFEHDTINPPGLKRHDDILLNHGENNWCFSCHDIKQRDRLALTAGDTVGYDEVPRLCAKCHGPTWRDWQRGIHGKTVGSWKTGDGRQRRLSCTECHDPHAPAFAAGVPLPGPNTIRMGEHVAHSDDLVHRPLAQWMHHIAEEDLSDGASH